MSNLHGAIHFSSPDLLNASILVSYTFNSLYMITFPLARHSTDSLLCCAVRQSRDIEDRQSVFQRGGGGGGGHQVSYKLKGALAGAVLSVLVTLEGANRT